MATAGGSRSILDEIGWWRLCIIVWRAIPLPWRLIAFPYGVFVYRGLFAASSSQRYLHAVGSSLAAQPPPNLVMRDELARLGGRQTRGDLLADVYLIHQIIPRGLVGKPVQQFSCLFFDCCHRNQFLPADNQRRSPTRIPPSNLYVHPIRFGSTRQKP